MKKLFVLLLAALLLALPALAEAIETEAPAAQGALQDAIPPQPLEDAVPAQPSEDAPELVWDDTIQQSAVDQADPDAASAPESGVVMQLVAQEKPLTGVRIGIDPGHQAKGNNQKETIAPNSKQTKPKVSSGTSGVSTHIPEYKTVLEISLKLRDALESQGAEVYMTRETHDVNISNQERAKMMNGYGVDLVLRIHCDGVDNHSKHGIAVYYSRSNSIAAESYRACEAILPAVCEVTGAKNNGIVSNDNYTGQNWSTVPCLMVECGFASNPEEDVLLNSEDYQWLLASGLTQGIIDYIEARDAARGE